MAEKTIALIDLSIIFRANWHATENEPTGEAFSRTVSDVKKRGGGYDHVAVCIDSPPYLRAELLPTYKAHREKAPERMHEQLRAVIGRLADDGHYIAGARGFEADDIIATLANTLAGNKIDIITGDKDLLQLVTEEVNVIRPHDGVRMTPAEVKDKLGVTPSQVVDYLSLVGDKSDGIPGVPGIGAVRAAEFLHAFGTLEDLYDTKSLMTLTENQRTKLTENKEAAWLARKLIELRTDAPIDASEIFAKREAKPLPVADEMGPGSGMDPADDEPEESPAPPNHEHARPSDPEPLPEPEIVAAPATVAPPQQAMAISGPVPYEMSLEPRNFNEARLLSKILLDGRLFGDFPNAQAVMGTIMTGRSLGIDAVASLRSFHNIKGKQTMSSTLMAGLVKRSPLCKYFRVVESTDEQAVYETHRVGEPEPTRMSFTIAEAKQAGLVPGRAGSNWASRPKTMLRHRCSTELARTVYPDILAGLYSAEEMEGS